jgi:hypothetical protein
MQGRKLGSVYYPDKCVPGRDAFEHEFDILFQLLEISV